MDQVVGCRQQHHPCGLVLLPYLAIWCMLGIWIDTVHRDTAPSMKPAVRQQFQCDKWLHFCCVRCVHGVQSRWVTCAAAALLVAFRQTRKESSASRYPSRPPLSRSTASWWTNQTRCWGRMRWAFQWPACRSFLLHLLLYGCAGGVHRLINIPWAPLTVAHCNLACKWDCALVYDEAQQPSGAFAPNPHRTQLRSTIYAPWHLLPARAITPFAVLHIRALRPRAPVTSRPTLLNHSGHSVCCSPRRS